MQKKVELAEVVITDLLNNRQSRVANLFAENSALGLLASEIGPQPLSALQKISQTARELAAADIAGISEVSEENGKPVFRWDHLSGEDPSLKNGTTPWNDSPCGYVLNKRAPQLFSRPERHYNLKTQATIEEVLIVPVFDKNNNTIAAIWIVSHQPSGKFDKEDVRLLTALAGLASAALQLIK